MGSIPTNHIWHYGACEDSDIEVYLDYDVAGGFKSPCENKFLWLSESKSIVPHQYTFIKMHYEKFCDCYKAIFTADRELVALHDKFIESPGGSNYTWVTPDKRGVHEKSKLVSMISSKIGKQVYHPKQRQFYASKPTISYEKAVAQGSLNSI